MSYFKNNIQFRIVAAKALESYKGNQAFMLNEVTRGEFGTTTKEILLLQYDTWFQWCMFAERFCLRHDVLTDDHIGMLLVDASNREQKNFDIMATNLDAFRPEIVAVYRETHKHLVAFFIMQVNACVGMKSIDAFPRFVSALTHMLNSTLFELDEIDTIMERKNVMPFLCVDDIGVEMFKKHKLSIPAERLRVYQSVRPDISQVIIKCYVEHEPEDVIKACGVIPMSELGATVAAINL